MEQKTNEWYEARLGKFTSSELYKLLTNGRAKDQEFGETSLTYIKDKLHEEFTKGTSLDYGFQGNKSTEWGEQFEPEARNTYNELSAIPAVECGFILSAVSEMFGGSPDGLVGEDGIIEIKCPYGSNHIKHLCYSNREEFKAGEKEYYAQIQGNLLATGRKWCDFVSYDPRYQNEKFRIKILRIERDEDFIKSATDKILKAENLFNQLLENIISQTLKN